MAGEQLQPPHPTRLDLATVGVDPALLAEVGFAGLLAPCVSWEDPNHAGIYYDVYESSAREKDFKPLLFVYRAADEEQRHYLVFEIKGSSDIGEGQKAELRLLRLLNKERKPLFAASELEAELGKFV